MFRKTILVLGAISAAIALAMLVAVGNPFKTLVSGGRADTARSAARMVVAPPTSVVGEFTGAYVDGVPVYRLPPIAVSTTRSEAIARIDRENAAKHARAGNAQVAEVRVPVHPATALTPARVVAGSPDARK